MSTSPLTLLEAVNIVLRNDGETPVAQLDEATFSEAADAEAAIHEISRTVQTDGHGFNTDYARLFTPNVSNEVEMPANTLWVRPAFTSAGRNIVERARKLYDLDENTFSFSTPVYLDVCECLEFEELPAAARYYITIRAARVYQARGTGSPQQNAFTSDDEARAEASMRKADRRMRRRGHFRQPSGVRATMRRPM
jgi:hypothetical protein